ncbi:MAG: FAD-binding oxidoreductase [Spirochaetes bacterium]|nr:FAD-binding oxidoreductase [Spirochaetota bacterium]
MKIENKNYHEEKLKIISEEFKTFVKDGRSVALKKKSVPHLVPNPKDERFKKKKLNLSALNKILEINETEKYAVAESGVTFHQLVHETLKYGLIPYTVPELKGITIGGAVSGCSIESMSYKLGGFHDSCIEYELISGRGEIITCSVDKETDVFNQIHGSYGTLGILTKLKFKLLDAKPFVKMNYEKYKNIEDYWSALKKACSDGNYDFIDGIIHGKNEHVICFGTLVETAPFLSKYDWLSIFYKSTNEKTEDYLAIADYFFRYDTECHWLTKSFPVLENKIFRFFFGKLFLGSTNLIALSAKLRHVLKLKKRPDVVVDVFIPSNKFLDFYRWYEKDFDFYPLWIVPYRMKSKYPWISDNFHKKVNDDLLIDCAIYGKKNNTQIDFSALLEDKVYEFNGVKTLISRNHYSESRFWEIYSKENFSNAKRKTDPDAYFPDLYTKFVKNQK